MRTIKFRGKLCHSKEWIYGNLIIANNGKPYIIPGDVLEPDGHHLRIDSDNAFWVDEETVGQFTGLIDKNGKEIFEGDIVFNSNRTLITLPEDKRLYLVKWQEGKYSEEKDWLKYNPGFIFEKIKFNDKKYMDLIFGQHQIEVVGNIHDNPELL